METIKVSHSRIVFNNGKVEIYDNVILVFKENFIAIAKDKNFIAIAKDKNDTVIIPYSNIMSIYCSENKWKEKKEDGRNENF